MSSPLQLADRRYRANASLVRRVERAIRRLWHQLNRNDLDRSWLRIGPQMVANVTVAQVQAARTADEYVAAMLAAQGIGRDSDGRLDPRAFGGHAADGRRLDTLLHQPIVTVRDTLAQGAKTVDALRAGETQLRLIVHSEVTDAGRVADGVALTARPAVAGYVRMLSPPSCSRCIQLAGQFYRWNDGFLRHPACDCRHVPVSEDDPDDLRTNPMAYFESLSEAEQNRVFTKAGAQAIRDGADMNRVVNARRGMYTAGGRRFTREGAGATPRPMPEQIYRDAESREDAIRLLRRFGYIL